MKKTLTFAFAALLCLTVAGWDCPAQDYVATPVTISKEKVKQGGKLYYAHVVLEKQTLFSIAKAYEVTVDDIYAANPGLKENGLRTNSIILIPTEGSAGAASGSGSSAQETDSGSGAASSESGSDSSADSGTGSGTDSGSVSGTDSGSVAGGDSGSGAASGTSDSGSKSRKSAKKSDTRQDYFIHTVKWYEDIDMISSKYGVSSDIIMKANNLTSRKLKTKQKLMIPTNPEEFDMSEPVSAGGSEDQALASSEGMSGWAGSQDETSSDLSEGGVSDLTWGEGEAESSGDEDNSGGFFRRFGPQRGRGGVNALLMLPFNATSASSSEISMDFYCGALLAARDLAEEGVDLNLGVYDTYGDILPITMESVSSSDLVIGLLSSGGFSSLLGSVPSGTCVVSPLDYRTESLAESYPNFISCANSTSAQYEDLASWIREDLQPGDSVVVIYEKTTAGTEARNEMVAALEHYSYKWSSFSYTILQGRNITKSLSAHFNPDATNRILIASENEAFVNDVIRNLNLLIHSKYNIVLYGGSRIRSFENVDVENLHNTNFHSSLSFYIDYDSPKVRQFLMQYRALYNTEPSQTAFQGYDTMYYFASMLNRYGSSAESHLTDTTTPMLMSDFKFESAGQGLVRTAVRRIVYESDFSISYLR